MQKYQRELEHSIQARTDELQTAQAALQHAQKLEAIGKLTGGVAHDFNNILQVIGGNLQLLRDSFAGDTRSTRQLDTAAGAVERGAQLAAQLLAFARRQPLQLRVIAPASVVQQMDELLRRAVGETVAVETIKGVPTRTRGSYLVQPLSLKGLNDWLTQAAAAFRSTLSQ